MNKKFNKIVIVSLCENYTKSFGKKCSQNLDMLFCDTNEMIEYELIDKKAVEEFCTIEYLQKSEKLVLKHIASFVNVVVAINYDYIIHNYNIFKQESIIVFLNLPKKYVKENGNVVDAISYEGRSAELKKIATITINIRNIEQDMIYEKLLKELGGIL